MNNQEHFDNFDLNENRNKRSRNSQNWITFSSNRSHQKSSFTPYLMIDYPLSKRLNLTFEIFKGGLNKLTFFICYLNGKDIFMSKQFQKKLKRRGINKMKILKLMKDHSEYGIRRFLKFVCNTFNLSKNKRSFFIIRFYDNMFNFETWNTFNLSSDDE